MQQEDLTEEELLKEKKKRRKKREKKRWILTFVLLACFAVAASLYVAKGNYYYDHFFEDTSFNGIKVGAVTAEEAKKIGTVDFLVQGTIYPDVIESGLGKSSVIKSHHNVGGLPDYVDFKEIVEPLRNLFKDEVRKVGRELQIPDFIVNRQPFPGPGLAIRVIGDITDDKLDILKDADYIFREEIKLNNMEKELSQYFAVLTDTRSVGVMGDERTYDYLIALRAVITDDFMTAKFAKIPYEILEKISQRIVNEVDHVNRVVYDITSKPPATIEWE